MQDVQFNTMLLASSDRALMRRRGEALAEASDFESNLAAVAPEPAASVKMTAAEPAPAAPTTSAAGVQTLTGNQMDALMANFGQAGASPPAPRASGSAKSDKDSPAVAALKASPAAANLTTYQLKALLAGFGRDPGTDVIEMADTTESAAAPAPLPIADTMSATRFFPIARKANATPSLYAAVEPTGDVKAEPAVARYFATPPNDNSRSSLYGATPPEADATPRAAKVSVAGPQIAMKAATPDPTARYFPISSGTPRPAAITTHDAYLRAMDINARALGLSSRR